MIVDGVRVAIDLGLVVLIWIVQLVVYPSFRAMDRPSFARWHPVYTKRISIIVVPLMLAQLALAAFRLFVGPTTIAFASFALVTVAWLATFALAIPAHEALRRHGLDLSTVDRLLQGNLVRAFAWTAVLPLDAVSFARSFAAGA